MHRIAPVLLRLCLVLVSAGAVHAAPLIEKKDRLEVNWGTLKLRFYGEANAGTDADGYRSAEKRAWRDGMNYISDTVRDLNVSTNEGLVNSQDQLKGDAGAAAKQVSQASASVYTTYYGDGSVRVLLETLLPKALETSAIHFHQKEAGDTPMTQYTGLILKTNVAAKPRATYQVVDETGAVLFDVKDMAEESYKKHLMGRWFKRPTSSELVDAVGKNPVTVTAMATDGKFQVQKAEWEKALEGHRALLLGGAIAIAEP